jgi:hypothetical protein
MELQTAKRMGKAFSLGLAWSKGFAYARNRKIAFDEDKADSGEHWITVNGVHVKTDGENLLGEIGKKIENETRNKSKKQLQREHKAKTATEFYGEEIKGENLKGEKALNRLLKEQKGYIKAAFHRDDIGDIDLVWGDSEAGLCHIIRQRIQKGQSVENVLNSLCQAIQNGVKEKKYQRSGSIGLFYEGMVVSISETFKGENKHLVITAYFPGKES